MPSHIIHVLSGRAALKVPDASRTVRNEAAFNLGCQGPDIFSHNRRTKPYGLAYSRLLHRRDYGRFCAIFAEGLVSRPSPLLESWFYGFVSHQTVDRAFHPYIVNRSFVPGNTGLPGVSPAHLHAFLERILDVCVLETIEGLPLSGFDTDKAFNPGPDETRTIAEAVASALILTYPEEAANDPEIRIRCENAFTDALYYYEMTNPAVTALDRPAACSGMQRFVELGIGGVALLHPDVSSSGIDWLNAERKTWLHPVSGEPLRTSVADLYAASVRDASKIIAAAAVVLSGGMPSASLEEAAGNGCLSVSGSDGKIGTVEYFEPFDLAAVLVAQAKKRKDWLAGTVC